MKESRRNVLKGAGALAAVIAAGAFTVSNTEAEAKESQSNHERGMAKGLTLLTMRTGASGEFRLGVKTDKGILGVPAAAKLLKMRAPGTMDDLLQNEDGPALMALVAAAQKSAAAKPSFLKEESIQYGPLVSRPRKIICVGLNYRRHAQEIGAPIPKEPVLFSKYINTLNNHNGSIKLPVEVAKKFDYEIELVIVMGKKAKNVSEADSHSYVAG